ncbi:SCO family protein [Thalassotalea ponticola]|uniref:SCO family protein n=1 Tax=Thalassotalea ponticola TaxID=1523392 RepID=UPI0025B2CB4A|nr:SCO family protein [Thalassotalea ponticola]MDN3652289.1 SCO family protein [Thalassotalea ponticola]
MNKLLTLLLAIVAVAIGVFAYKSQQQQAEPSHALLYKQTRSLADFSLTDHQGNVFNNENLYGKYSLFFFGYTSCPDICPMTLQELNYIYPELKNITNDKVQVVMVSADPKRDSVEKLNQYMQYFNDEFIAVRAGHDVLFPFSRNIGLMYAIAEDTNEEFYLVNHSASIVMTNPKGQIQAIFKPVQGEPGTVPAIDSDRMLADFRIIHSQLN